MISGKGDGSRFCSRLIHGQVSVSHFHLVLIHSETRARTVVPVHPGRTIKEPLLHAIVRDANLSVNEFIALL
ncbi:MAG: type II toxin-antitoxin system HicA family toxin [Acidobacteriales bacterium]|nr:MAG: type II toxin-antitoxin system HicA family toxin [Terriglobales bacterium]